MWKKLGGLFIVLLVIGGGMYVYVITRISHSIVDTIEKNGTAATTTTVAVRSVGLSLFFGRCVITGLTVANPPGFNTPYAIKLGTITIHVALRSLISSGPLIVDEVTIDQPHIYLELTAGLKDFSLKNLDLSSNTNLGTLARNAQTGQGTSESNPSRKEIIDNLYVDDGKVSIFTTLLKHQRLIEHLPVIHLSGIGAGSGGVTTGKVSSLVLTAITNQAILQSAGALVHVLGAAVTLPLDNVIVDKVKSLF